ncbi:MAG: FAD-dependent 5-carboxymethylaminomethyl-2-thiouridine(34) oxidoreductase MnmC [Betaproteobacteria bacterium]|nr:FAD-dependent 5-carboxymethylaminomethyl-2-thiouridine(34) oxidoreductase MnmC [Betaproteobacteria bacterium]MDE2123448.1 FAD-dependent 5-carboxymethylaminomethyl-2-thiouridine(34) oxidoreductase MnmC [Betaproteobacteria bacterium]MDE2185461.1 FAD-dependent 5-carboxymethylaminomethyl-2-thiouridine(34) oxidoreductase MnmC [Betaproteobacteria bacterium]MDE2324428.1 FAD-dependent 5-carboxymethylaminomethyl-2-thiouridine(34) oxidoreductase MnmC [Betaproteobacteria bacterium]
MSRPAPIHPQPLARNAEGQPCSARASDASDGALVRARAVFLDGCGLLDAPPAWAGRRQFVVLETGFGRGTRFLATWQAWLADAARPDTLHCVCVEWHPLAATDLIAACTDPSLLPLAHQLAGAWPPAMRGLHQLQFAAGRVKLTLALGDASELLPRLDLGADAIYLGGLTALGNPALRDPGVIKAAARLARPGARLASSSVDPALCATLRQAGFTLRKLPCENTRAERLQAVYAPRWRTRRLEPRDAATGVERRALVIGAGLAGAASAQALARRGWTVDVLDAGCAAAGASALPAGLAHARISADDDRLARLGRAGLAALVAALPGSERHALWQGGGLLLAEPDSALPDLAAIATALALPSSVAEVVDAGEASRRTGAQVDRGGWWQAGGVAAAGSLVRAWLATPGVRLQGAVRVQRLRRAPGFTAVQPARSGHAMAPWQALDATGHVLAQAPVCIVASALDAARLLRASGLDPGDPCLQDSQGLPLRAQAGQAFLVPASSLPRLARLQRPLVGGAYVLPLPPAALQALELPAGEPWQLLGATYENDPEGLMPIAAAWAHIAQELEPLVGALPAAPPAEARVFRGVRAVAADRLPCAGAWPDWEALARARPAALQRPADELPPQPGLYLSTAMGSRGLTLAALAAECIASHIEGEPAPLERDLLAALAPGRFGLRQLQRRDAADG